MSRERRGAMGPRKRAAERGEGPPRLKMSRERRGAKGPRKEAASSGVGGVPNAAAALGCPWGPRPSIKTRGVPSLVEGRD